MAFAQSPGPEAEADAAPSLAPTFAAAGDACPGAGAGGVRAVGRNGKRILDVERPVTVTEKACGTCKQVLPASEFHRSSKRKDGLQVRTVLQHCLSRPNEAAPQLIQHGLHRLHGQPALTVCRFKRQRYVRGAKRAPCCAEPVPHVSGQAALCMAERNPAGAGACGGYQGLRRVRARLHVPGAFPCLNTLFASACKRWFVCAWHVLLIFCNLPATSSTLQLASGQ